MRSSALFAFGVILVGALAGCGDAKSTATTWVYDEAVTIKHTDPQQHASVRKHFAGFSLTLVIDQGAFVMTQVGGPTPGVHKGMSKATFNGIQLTTQTIDGKAVADPASAQVSCRQPTPGRMEFNSGGFIANLVRK